MLRRLRIIEKMKNIFIFIVLTRVRRGFFENSKTICDFDFDATRLKSMPKNLKITKKKFENFSRKFFFWGSKSDFFSFSHFSPRDVDFFGHFFSLKIIYRFPSIRCKKQILTLGIVRGSKSRLKVVDSGFF